ncbi:glycoside hydrolase family 16 protein [Galactobacter caseinivorans]|uniref:Glycoside hydrolase family 16 protein n=1 Tax=Galactobacter caseinivorans TaxID=2676123 RepID=A0A496PL32_9MICC|nr:glycoside hydrolase family 16 protein [Galactobacter caseinivorans]RKW71127.1 glycoside hydrolase family 16 protein [Galactobacter caseinivorans]
MLITRRPRRGVFALPVVAAVLLSGVVVSSPSLQTRGAQTAAPQMERAAAIVLDGKPWDLKPGETRRGDLGTSTGHTTTKQRVTLSSGQGISVEVRLRESTAGYYAVRLYQAKDGQRWINAERVVAGKRATLKSVKLANAPATSQSLWLSAEVQNEPSGDRIWASAWDAAGARPAEQISHLDRPALPRAAPAKTSIQATANAANTGPVKVTLGEPQFKDVDETVLTPGTWGSPAFRTDFPTGAANPLTGWTVRNDTYVGYDVGYVKASNVEIRDGAAILSTRKVDTPWVMKDGVKRYYSTAYMDTDTTFSQAYGRWEMRAKLPTVKQKSKGIWPAFWLRPVDKGTGELDIMEAYGTPKTVHNASETNSLATVHYGTMAGENRTHTVGFTPKEIDVNDGRFHTWTLEWTPKGVTFFVDGKAYFTQLRGANPTWDALYQSGRKYSIRLNVQAGSEYAGQPNDKDTAPHTEYVVDHVRAWSYKAG